MKTKVVIRKTGSLDSAETFQSQSKFILHDKSKSDIIKESNSVDNSCDLIEEKEKNSDEEEEYFDDETIAANHVKSLKEKFEKSEMNSFINDRVNKIKKNHDKVDSIPYVTVLVKDSNKFLDITTMVDKSLDISKMVDDITDKVSLIHI